MLFSQKCISSSAALTIIPPLMLYNKNQPRGTIEYMRLKNWLSHRIRTFMSSRTRVRDPHPTEVSKVSKAKEAEGKERMAKGSNPYTLSSRPYAQTSFSILPHKSWLYVFLLI